MRKTKKLESEIAANLRAHGKAKYADMFSPRSRSRVHHSSRLPPIRSKYKLAKDIVDGRIVRDGIPNMDSVSSSLGNYEILRGVREVPLSAFTQMGPGSPSYYSTSEMNRTKHLAEMIRESKEIDPLIVVEDVEGPYILEGGHRFDALRELKAKAFPALVVLDLDSLGTLESA